MKSSLPPPTTKLFLSPIKFLYLLGLPMMILAPGHQFSSWLYAATQLALRHPCRKIMRTIAQSLALSSIGSTPVLIEVIRLLLNDLKLP